MSGTRARVEALGVEAVKESISSLDAHISAASSAIAGCGGKPISSMGPSEAIETSPTRSSTESEMDEYVVNCC
jgi:hypothetical protein